jgi:hypothetical protein
MNALWRISLHNPSPSSTESFYADNPPMNTILPPPESPLLLTGAPPEFNIVVIYETANPGRHAKRFSDKLLSEIGDDCQCVRSLWSFDVLGITAVRNAAAGAARAADLLIVSTSGESELSPHVEKWLDLWVWLIDDASPALVALFQDRDGGCVRNIIINLRRLAGERGLEFFPHATFQPSASLVCSERQHLADSTPRHSNRAEPAGAGTTAAQSVTENPHCVAGTAGRRAP